MTRGLLNILEQENKNAAARSSGERKMRTRYFVESIPYSPNEDYQLKEPGSSVILQFITPQEEWVQVLWHDFIPVKPGAPTRKKFVQAPCGYDPNFGHGECYVCDAKVTTNPKYGPLKQKKVVSVLALVMKQLRVDTQEDVERIRKEQGVTFPIGTILGATPLLEEFEPEGDFKDMPTNENGKVLIPKFAELTLPIWSFGRMMGPAVLANGGDINGRPFEITRQGTKLDTAYIPTPLDRDNSFRPGTPLWKSTVEDWMERLGINHEDKLKYLGSEKYYAKFIDPTKESVSDSGQGDPQAQQALAAEKPSEASMAEVNAKIKASLGSMSF